MVDQNKPLVRVIKFHQTFERVAVKGDELKDDVDAKGFKIDEKGKRVLKNVEVDWVTYAPSHAPLSSMTTDRIRHMQPTPEMLSGESSEKLKFLLARWAAIEPAYEAWKAGHELPTDGMPLSHWPGVTSAMADTLKSYGIRTVEEVRDLMDGQLEKVRLPNMRELRKTAAAFLDNVRVSQAAERDVERDNEVAGLKEQLREQQERLDAAMALLEQQTNPNNGKNELDELRAALDAKGIKYHPNSKAATLRALLTEDAA